MKRQEMIKDKSLFNKIIKTGKFTKNSKYIVYSLPNSDPKINFGIAISKKVGNAVTRNHLKRQTRAIIDNKRKLFKNGFNYIIMIRKSCQNSKYSELEQALKDLLH